MILIILLLPEQQHAKVIIFMNNLNWLIQKIYKLNIQLAKIQICIKFGTFSWCGIAFIHQ